MNQDSPSMVQHLNLPETVDVIDLTTNDKSPNTGEGDGENEVNIDLIFGTNPAQTTETEALN